MSEETFSLLHRRKLMLWTVTLPIKEINKIIPNLSALIHLYISQMLTVETACVEPASGHGSLARLGSCHPTDPRNQEPAFWASNFFLFCFVFFPNILDPFSYFLRLQVISGFTWSPLWRAFLTGSGNKFLPELHKPAIRRPSPESGDEVEEV